MNKQLVLGGITAALWALSAGASAQSADLNSWIRAGDVTVDSATTATMTTASTASGEVALSGNDALFAYALESALNIGGSLPVKPLFETQEGSGLALSFSTVGPTNISFSWTLATDSYDPGFADVGFAVIDGITFQLLGTVGASSVSGSFSQTFSGGGAHALAFGVVDVNDTTGISTLSVSNFAVTAVPEPGGVAMMLAGLGALGAMARRRRV